MVLFNILKYMLLPFEACFQPWPLDVKSIDVRSADLAYQYQSIVVLEILRCYPWQRIWVGILACYKRIKHPQDCSRGQQGNKEQSTPPPPNAHSHKAIPPIEAPLCSAITLRPHCEHSTKSTIPRLPPPSQITIIPSILLLLSSQAR